MPGRRMMVLAALVAGSMLAGASGASADVEPWGARLMNGNGSVDVSADRKDITVCDLEADDDFVGAEYETTAGRTINVQAGPGRQCVSDSVFFGRIRSVMLCHGPDVNPEGGSLRWCDPRTTF
ncbi:hypothetical protein N5079_22665 [Planotetraspora sp. A-T 1434]|uniref:hypothetical protein n=1 Tax=Planotetraspora sp. A-T 1434 TaxID=2979219 RepID=UPI0021C253FB|nr:hypothetical protein [Planotetraspora sp. A-T 1434]MCT9933016.1 hypothetical protein [Planotetraspora sp. A-T 1434]